MNIHQSAITARVAYISNRGLGVGLLSLHTKDIALRPAGSLNGLIQEVNQFFCRITAVNLNLDRPYVQRCGFGTKYHVKGTQQS